MRLLHVGSGFRPWRRGGLVAYVEDLMAEQARRGHELTYFFAGRQYPLARRTRLRPWARDEIAMLEVVDSPLYDHGRQPELELSAPAIERMFARVIAQVRPDVVHVHELAGLPTSLLEISRDAGLPVVFTLQDYFPLCPAFKLLDADGLVCTRHDVGEACVATIASEPRRRGLLIEATVGLHLRRLVPRAGAEPRIQRLAERAGRLGTQRGAAPVGAAAFQRRRDVNVERLNRVDRLVAMSHRVAEIYTERGVDADRIRTMQLTLAHLEQLRPGGVPTTPPLTFATLAGLESVPKGGRILLDALAMLPAGACRILAYGHVDPALAAAARATPGLELRGTFGPSELDAILDEVDVGLVPSVWEEAYGYVGMEFLAKGVPLIANAIGGMTDYTREGETGWLNRSCSADELAAIMRRLIDDPAEVARVADRVRSERAAIVKPLARHADEMDAVYAELIGARAPS